MASSGMLRRVVFVRTGVSEKPSASIILMIMCTKISLRKTGLSPQTIDEFLSHRYRPSLVIADEHDHVPAYVGPLIKVWDQFSSEQLTTLDKYVVTEEDPSEGKPYRDVICS
jgi:hypothetical protein